jgi:hypothetical protein
MINEKRLLSNKNIKLNGIFSFSLPAILTCNKKYIKHCSKYCYALKIGKLYPQYNVKMNYNYNESLKDSFIERINRELRTASRYIRLHVSGDFYSQEYLDKWVNIAKSNKGNIFYTYTKNIDLDFSQRPKNLIIYLSDDLRKAKQDTIKRFDGIASIKFTESKETDFKGFFVCLGDCSDCFKCMEKGNKILFKKH